MKVSIYIISKDRPRLLRRAIRSCLNQTFQNIEVIIVDDCSESFDIFDLEKEFPSNKCRFFRAEEPRGANYCRNLAIQKSSGEYVTGLDDDDFFHPARIEIMLNTLIKKRFNVSGVSSRHMFESVFDRGNIKTAIINLFKMASTVLSKGKTISADDILNKNSVGNQVLIKKEFLVKVGLFDEKLPALQDYEAWLRVTSEIGPIYRVNKFLYFKNDYSNSVTKNNRKKLAGFEYILKKHSNLFKGNEDCFLLHKTFYSQNHLTVNQAISLFSGKNKSYIIWLLITLKVKI